MRISLQPTTVFKAIIRLSKNDDFKAFEGVLKIRHLAGRSGVY